jgi:4-amino-4-deoxy-L-arabinose transferase-like glycosyltransferase
MELGVLWLVNPILSGVCVFLIYALFCDLYSRSAARIAVLLLCCSPWFIFMGMSLMSHTLTLVCALSAAVFLRKALRSGTAAYALASGLFVGILSLVRPYDGVLVAALLGAWTIVSAKTLGSRFLKHGIALALGTVITGALVFPYNKAVTGEALVSPPDAYYAKYFWPGANSIGFGPDRGFHWALDAFPGHSPTEAIVNAALNSFLLDTELFGWGTGSLILLLLFFLSRKVERKDIWALATIATIVGGYSLFWYHGGPDFGARYWFLCVIPLIALTVRGVQWLAREVADLNSSALASDPRVMLAVLVLCVGAVVCYLPWRSLDKYYHYLRMQPGITELARQNDFGKSLVLIRGDEHPDYQSAWVYNPVNFDGDVPLYAFDKSEDIEVELLNAYPDRPVWIVDGPSRTNRDYRIVAGPLTSGELLIKGNRYLIRN